MTRPHALSFGLADILAADGEAAAAAAIRLLRPVDPLVMLATKRAVNALSAEEETGAFEGVWGKGAHMAAFAAVLSKNK